MRNALLQSLILVMSCCLVMTIPVLHQDAVHSVRKNRETSSSGWKEERKTPNNDGEVISVRITSSVAVNRGHNKKNRKEIEEKKQLFIPETVTPLPNKVTISSVATTDAGSTILPKELEGANLEFIKQLNQRKASLGTKLTENVNYLEDSEIGETVHSEVETLPIESDTIIDDEVPRARSISFNPSYRNNLHFQHPYSRYEKMNDKKITTINFSIIHETQPTTAGYNKPVEGYNMDQVNSYSNTESFYRNPSSVHPESSTDISKPLDYRESSNIKSKPYKDLSEPPKLNSGFSKIFSEAPKIYSEPPKIYSEPPKIYSEPPKIYSEPAKVYSEPAKVYGEPSKIYSEPAKVYGEPAKVYSEPAKVYGEPAKFYSQPASLNLPPSMSVKMTTLEDLFPIKSAKLHDSINGTLNTTPVTAVTNITTTETAERNSEHQPEKNYEVDEKVSVMTDGKSHGVQENSNKDQENCKQDNCKVGYVVEGKQYRKYRVEERTPDGFIVGEYGVVRHEDGALRGVRYTADSEASPRLIYDALMKFLQL